MVDWSLYQGGVPFLYCGLLETVMMSLRNLVLNQAVQFEASAWLIYVMWFTLNQCGNWRSPKTSICRGLPSATITRWQWELNPRYSAHCPIGIDPDPATTRVQTVEVDRANIIASFDWHNTLDSALNPLGLLDDSVVENFVALDQAAGREIEFHIVSYSGTETLWATRETAENLCGYLRERGLKFREVFICPDTTRKPKNLSASNGIWPSFTIWGFTIKTYQRDGDII